MATVFSMIIAGDLPGRFVWQDEVCVAFLSIHPLSPGHTLVVPRVEVDHWLDLDEDAIAHLSRVSHRIGQAVQAVWQPARVAQIIAGFEVPHVHLHVIGAADMVTLNFANADTDPDAAGLDHASTSIREHLRGQGWGEHVPD